MTDDYGRQVRKQLADAQAELAALHAGEEPYEDERLVPTPAQWIWKWNRATVAERLTQASHILTDRYRLARGRQTLAFHGDRPGLEQALHAAIGDGPAACPDPVECGHEAALGQAEARIAAVRALLDCHLGCESHEAAGLRAAIRTALDGPAEQPERYPDGPS